MFSGPGGAADSVGTPQPDGRIRPNCQRQGELQCAGGRLQNRCVRRNQLAAGYALIRFNRSALCSDTAWFVGFPVIVFSAKESRLNENASPQNPAGLENAGEKSAR